MKPLKRRVSKRITNFDETLHSAFRKGWRKIALLIKLAEKLVVHYSKSNSSQGLTLNEAFPSSFNLFLASSGRRLKSETPTNRPIEKKPILKFEHYKQGTCFPPALALQGL